MITIAYSGRSRPTAEKFAELDDEVTIIRRSQQESDVNWGRAVANSKLNPDISNVTNKRVMRELFAEHGVPMPRLLEHESEDGSELGEFLDNGGVAIGRPDIHSKGRGLWKVDTFGKALIALRGTKKKRAATHFMEFVEADREYRVHIFKGKSIRISRKEFDGDGSNKYTTAKPGDIKLRNVREAAKAAVAAVGLDFGAVDILARGEANEQVWCLEVNAAPGLGGSMPQLYLDTFKRWKAGDWEDDDTFVYDTKDARDLIEQNLLKALFEIAKKRIEEANNDQL